MTSRTCDPAQDSERLRGRLEDLRQFAQYTAHELKNPLRALMLACESVLNEVNHHKQVGTAVESDFLSDRLGQIAEETSHLNNRVSRLLTMFVEPDEPTPLDLIDWKTVADQAVRTCGRELNQANASVTIDPALATVFSDRLIAETVLVNLVSNAIRYRSPDHPLRITIDTSTEEDTWLVRVADNGRGIHPADHKRIFAPLGRVSHDTNGHGLGLALAFRSIDHIGGQIGVHSQLGAGATFWVRIPIFPARSKGSGSGRPPEAGQGLTGR